MAKILIWFQEKENICLGFQFFDKNDSHIFETLGNFFTSNQAKKEIVLEEGERIVGIRSRKHDDQRAYHCDLQFIIGKMVWNWSIRKVMSISY